MYFLRTDTAGELNPATLINKTVIRENSCRNSITCSCPQQHGAKTGAGKNVNYILLVQDNLTKKRREDETT